MEEFDKLSTTTTSYPVSYQRQYCMATYTHQTCYSACTYTEKTLFIGPYCNIISSRENGFQLPALLQSITSWVVTAWYLVAGWYWNVKRLFSIKFHSFRMIASEAHKKPFGLGIKVTVPILVSSIINTYPKRKATLLHMSRKTGSIIKRIKKYPD